MDFDTVEILNLDRLIAATRLDAALLRSKVYVAVRGMRGAATARMPELQGYELNVCEPAGLRIALNYDLVFSCVDRPWPRSVLNQIAFSDLIPVVDGGLAMSRSRVGACATPPGGPTSSHRGGHASNAMVRLPVRRSREIGRGCSTMTLTSEQPAPSCRPVRTSRS